MSLIRLARILSMLFTPFYLPLVGMIALLTCSYLSLLPLSYKLQVILATYIMTLLVPTLLIHAYRKYHGWKPFVLSDREKRVVPYTISIICYLLCYYVMQTFHVPHFMSAIIMSALFVQVVCALINVFYKVSAHMSAIGSMAGGVAAFSLILGFNAVWWLALIIFIAGLLGTARMILQVHNLSQIVSGFIIGLFTTFIVIILM